MTNPAPVLTLKGTVRSAEPRHVRAVEARPAERDPDGRVVRGPIEARDSYDVVDVVVLTEDGGFASVLVGGAALARLQGEVPSLGDSVDWRVRCYVTWQGSPGRRFATVGYSLAADLLRSAVRHSSADPVKA